MVMDIVDKRDAELAAEGQDVGGSVGDIIIAL